MKYEKDLALEQNQKAWRAVSAKVGHGSAAEIRVGGTIQECHDKRKMVRQAVNAITLDQGSRSPTEEEMNAMQHASTLVAGLNSTIDMLEKGRDSGARTSQAVMRNAADYRSHYRRGESGFGQEEIGIDEFFKGVANLPTTTAVRNALSVGTNTSGGFAVPSIMMPRILEAMVPHSALLQAGMGVVDLSDMSGKDFTSAAVANIPTADWRLENGTVPESDPSFRAVVATPRSLAFFFKVSRELLADAPNMQEALMTAIGQAFAKALDRTGLRGSGVAPEPLGLRGLATINSVNQGVDGSALWDYSTMLNGIKKILQGDGPMPTSAIMSPAGLIHLANIKEDTIQNTGQHLIPPKMLDGIPFFYTSQIPDNLVVGSSTDCTEIYLGDFTRMSMMLREGVSVQLLNERYAETGQIGFVCHVRADFAVNYPKAFCLMTGVRVNSA